jgi:TolB protein
VINGAPLFSAWCTDNNFLAVHAGEELAVVEVDGSRTTAEVAPHALGFRTPAYSDDAEVLAYALSAEGGVALMRARFQGTGSSEVCRFPGGVALAFRPGTQELTVAVTRDPSNGGFDELWTVDLSSEGAPKTCIARGSFVTALWDPTGTHMVLFAPTFSGDGKYAGRLLSPQGNVLGTSEAFFPSDDFRIYLGFFDQYANSHALWTAEGDRIVIAGRLGGDGVSPSFGDPEPSYVMTWTVGPSARLKVVASGEIGFCAPLPKMLH